MAKTYAMDCEEHPLLHDSWNDSARGGKKTEFCFVQTSSLSGNVGNSHLYYIYILKKKTAEAKLNGNVAQTVQVLVAECHQVKHNFFG